MSACRRNDGVDVREHGVIERQRRTVVAEYHTGSRVTQQEQAHDRHAVCGDGSQRPIEPLQRLWFAAETSIREPSAGAYVGAVINPGEIDADDEAVRLPRRPHRIRSFAATTIEEEQRIGFDRLRGLASTQLALGCLDRVVNPLPRVLG